MTETSYQPEMITGYLLGSLPAKETERLDELSITDPAFADSLMAAENELVDAYILGELDDEQRLQFETHYLASANRRDNVKFAQAFQSFGNRQTHLSASQQRVNTPVEGTGWFSSLKSYFSPRATLQWGFATVALLLLVVGGWLVLQNIRLRQQISTSQARNNELLQREQQLQRELETERLAKHTAEPQPVPEPAQEKRGPARPPQPESTVFSLVLTPQLRSAQQRTTVDLKPETSWVDIKLALEPDDYSTYQVMLLEQASHRPVWHSPNLRSRTAGGAETLDVRIRASVLKARSYVFRVTGIAAGASDIVGEYQIHVTKQ